MKDKETIMKKLREVEAMKKCFKDRYTFMYAECIGWIRALNWVLEDDKNE